MPEHNPGPATRLGVQTHELIAQRFEVFVREKVKAHLGSPVYGLLLLDIKSHRWSPQTGERGDSSL